MPPRALALGVGALAAPTLLLPSCALALLHPIQSHSLALHQIVQPRSLVLHRYVPVATAWYLPHPALVVLVARLLGTILGLGLVLPLLAVLVTGVVVVLLLDAAPGLGLVPL